jgi:hypothetical protein
VRPERFRKQNFMLEKIYEKVPENFPERFRSGKLGGNLYALNALQKDDISLSVLL